MLLKSLQECPNDGNLPYLLMLTDAEIDALEEQVPALIEPGLHQAYLKTLAAGPSVLVREDDHLMEVFPDGTKRRIRPLATMLSVPKGAVLRVPPVQMEP